MPLVVAFDPGEVTGWSSWYYDSTTPMTRDEYGLIKGAHAGFIAWCMAHHPLLREAIVIVEHYVQDGGPGKSEEPLMIEGALECTLAYLASPPAVRQGRSVKRQVADGVLKEAGLWLSGKDALIRHEDARDVNDSQIHALAWAKLLGHQPTIATYWPDR